MALLENDRFYIKVTGNFKRCLERQVNEDIRIQHCEAEGGQFHLEMNITHPQVYSQCSVLSSVAQACFGLSTLLPVC